MMGTIIILFYRLVKQMQARGFYCTYLTPKTIISQEKDPHKGSSDPLSSPGFCLPKLHSIDAHKNMLKKHIPATSLHPFTSASFNLSDPAQMLLFPKTPM